MSWQEERRRDREARAEQGRRDAVAAAQVETIRAQAQTDAQLAAAAAADRLRREAERDRRAAAAADHARRVEQRDAARVRRQRRYAALQVWATAHVVDLLIYPLAVVSAVMAVPAMAEFGHDVYGTAAGYALPVITELGMWSFALAIQHTRRAHPDRPVWALQVGVWLFASIAFALNALHGLTRSWVNGSVMGVASVAGVAAHQLVTAAPRRSRTERETQRAARRANRKVARVRRAAIDTAVAEIDPEGTARLVFVPGRFVLGTGRRGRRILESATVPGLPVTPTEGDEWDRAFADLVAHSGHTPPTVDLPGGVEQAGSGGSVATLDHDPDATPDVGDDLRESRSTRRANPGRDRAPKRSTRASGRTTNQASGGGRSSGRAPRRSIEELRTALRGAIEADPGSIDPTSAESIRRALKCAPKYARQLRDEHGQGGR